MLGGAGPRRWAGFNTPPRPARAPSRRRPHASRPARDLAVHARPAGPTPRPHRRDPRQPPDPRPRPRGTSGSQKAGDARSTVVLPAAPRPPSHSRSLRHPDAVTDSQRDCVGPSPDRGDRRTVAGRGQADLTLPVGTPPRPGPSRPARRPPRRQVPEARGRPTSPTGSPAWGRARTRGDGTRHRNGGAAPPNQTNRRNKRGGEIGRR